MSADNAIDARTEAWEKFCASAMGRLIAHSDIPDLTIECIYKQGFNDGLRAALEYLSRNHDDTI
jgi:hypothetical protein